jgi:hypothetical protein
LELREKFAPFSIKPTHRSFRVLQMESGEQSELPDGSRVQEDTKSSSHWIWINSVSTSTSSSLYDAFLFYHLNP